MSGDGPLIQTLACQTFDYNDYYLKTVGSKIEGSFLSSAIAIASVKGKRLSKTAEPTNFSQGKPASRKRQAGKQAERRSNTNIAVRTPYVHFSQSLYSRAFD